MNTNSCQPLQPTAELTGDRGDAGQCVVPSFSGTSLKLGPVVSKPCGWPIFHNATHHQHTDHMI